MLNGFPWPLTGNRSKDTRNIDYAPSVFAFVIQSAKMQEDQCKQYTTAVQRSKRKLSAIQFMFVRNLRIKRPTGMKME